MAPLFIANVQIANLGAACHLLDHFGGAISLSDTDLERLKVGERVGDDAVAGGVGQGRDAVDEVLG